MAEQVQPEEKVIYVKIETPFVEVRTQHEFLPGEIYTTKELGWDDSRVGAYHARGRISILGPEAETVETENAENEFESEEEN